MYTHMCLKCSHCLRLKCSIICVLQSAWYEHFVGQITCISHVSSARWCFFSVGTGGYGYTVLCLSNPAAAPHYVPWAMYTCMCLTCSHSLHLKCSIICVLQSAWYEHFVGQITCISHVSSARWCSMFFSVGTGGYGYTVLCLSNPAAAPHYVPWCAMHGCVDIKSISRLITSGQAPDETVC